MIHFPTELSLAYWKTVADHAKSVGLYELNKESESHGMRFVELYEYLDCYGCREDGRRKPDAEHTTRVVVTPALKWDLGEHSFNLSFQRKKPGVVISQHSEEREPDTWTEFMNGGAVYAAGSGWSVHT